MHRCGACVPRTCVSEAQEGKQPMTTDSNTAWGSRREQCSSCDPQAVSLQPPPRPVPTRQPIGPAHPPQARLRSHSLDLMFWKAQRLVCARAEVGLLCARNALGPWDRGFRVPYTCESWLPSFSVLCCLRAPLSFLPLCRLLQTRWPLDGDGGVLWLPRAVSLTF